MGLTPPGAKRPREGTCPRCKRPLTDESFIEAPQSKSQDGAFLPLPRRHDDECEGERNCRGNK